MRASTVLVCNARTATGVSKANDSSMPTVHSFHTLKTFCCKVTCFNTEQTFANVWSVLQCTM